MLLQVPVVDVMFKVYSSSKAEIARFVTKCKPPETYDMMIVELQRQLEDHFSLKEMATLAKNRKESLHLRVTKLKRVYSIDSASQYTLHMGTIRSGTPYEFLCKCIVYSGCSYLGACINRNCSTGSYFVFDLTNLCTCSGHSTQLQMSDINVLP